MNPKIKTFTKRDEIIALAEKTKHYCDLLIEQSNNWLPEGKKKNGETKKSKNEKSNKDKTN